MADKSVSENIVDQIVECIEVIETSVKRLPELCRLNPGLTALYKINLVLPCLRGALTITQLRVKHDLLQSREWLMVVTLLHSCTNHLAILARLLDELEASYHTTQNPFGQTDLQDIYDALVSNTHALTQLQVKEASRETHPTVSPSSSHATTVISSPAHPMDSRSRSNISEPTPLFAASNRGQDLIVQLLLEQGADVNDGGYHNPESAWSPLCTAAKHGRESTVQILLAHGANLEAADHTGWTAIAAASKAGHVGIVKLLLREGANPSSRSKKQWSALHTASMHGRVEVIRVLLDGGADAKVKDDRGRTPLLVAIEEGREDIAKLLLAYEHRNPPPAYEASTLESQPSVHDNRVSSSRPSELPS